MDSISNNKKSGINSIAILIVFILFYSIIVIRCAWLGDDAYITFRVVDNFINGYGLRWNIAERVQAYTHPLWMFLISIGYFITGNIYYTGIFTSIIISIITVSIVAFVFPISIYSAILGISVLTASKAYVDYSTSGLENPLTHLLVVLFFFIYIRWENSSKKIFYLALLTSLAAVNRVDTILLVLPALACSILYLKQYKKSFKILSLGLIPFISWELFSLVYYGFLFPNTAYAKLNTGIKTILLVKQSIIYFKDSLVHDPLTLIVILTAIFVSVFKKAWKYVPITAGIILYLLYIVKIGGCFMSGRYFTAPLLCSVIVTSCLLFKTSNKSWILFLIIILTIGIVTKRAPIISSIDYGSNSTMQNYNGINSLRDHKNHMNGKLNNQAMIRKTISDERCFYYPETGLMRVMTGEIPDPSWSPSIQTKLHKINILNQMDSQDAKTEDSFIQAEGIVDKYELKMVIGRLGFAAGPSVHIVDILALTDPLLARLPAAEKVNFSIGHFKRRIPLGYLKTLKTGRNCLMNKNIAKFYDKLTIITRAKIFTAQRFIEIIKMNLGFYNYLTVDTYILPRLKAGSPNVIKQDETDEEQGILFSVN